MPKPTAIGSLLKRRMRWTSAEASLVISERAPVTPEMALRLGKLCGNGPELWLNLQSRFDIARLSKTKHAEIAAIPTLAAE